MALQSWDELIRSGFSPCDANSVRSDGFVMRSSTNGVSTWLASMQGMIQAFCGLLGMKGKDRFARNELSKKERRKIAKTLSLPSTRLANLSRPT